MMQERSDEFDVGVIVGRFLSWQQYREHYPNAIELPTKAHDHTGRRIGNFTVIEYAGKLKGRTCWALQCDCGAVEVKRPIEAEKTKHRQCFRCNLGTGRWTWRGCGGLPALIFSTLQRNARHRGIAFDLTIEEAWALFERQGGKCALTGWPLVFGAKRSNETTASLDRIDSTRGYEIDNVQWLHRDVNFLKRNYPNEHFVQMCMSIGSVAVGGEPIGQPAENFQWLKGAQR